jgi:hypothetical protein
LGEKASRWRRRWRWGRRRSCAGQSKQQESFFNSFENE